MRNFSSKLYHREIVDERANSVDPEEVALNELPHLDLCCLQFFRVQMLHDGTFSLQISEPQISGDIKDNLKIIFLISQ